MLKNRGMSKRPSRIRCSCPSLSKEPTSSCGPRTSYYVPPQDPPVCIEVKYALPVRSIYEHADGVDCRITWRGDDIVGIASKATSYYPVPANAST